jgi:signal transduction histidine kinase
VSGYFLFFYNLLSAFNAITFTLLSFLWLHDYRKRRTHWGGYLYLYIVVTCAVLFLSNLIDQFSWALVYHPVPFLVYAQITANALIPPLMFHFFYRNEKDYLPGRSVWKAALIADYTCGALFVALALHMPGPSRNFLADRSALMAYRVLMVIAATGCGFVLWTSQRPDTDLLYRNQRRSLTILCAVWTFIYLFAPVYRWGGVMAMMLPLCFGFFVTYYVERFTFFDVLIKKGAFAFFSLLLLMLYFQIAPPFLQRIWYDTATGNLFWALSILAMVLVAPWGHRKLSSWLDRRWLGRQFAPAEAAKHFVSGLHLAIDEDELARRAEWHLSEIFRSTAIIALGPAPLPAMEKKAGCMQAPIRLHSEEIGLIRVHARPHGPRFLSEDMTMLASLAETFSFLLENLRLREQHLQQEKREQELLLEANRSELRALRAQVNPHFMFNALNTIAGLIPRRPERAEETIEQLAEVFRYTLSRSEHEWVRLNEELEAVHAYLAIEQTRFGDRLKFSVAASAEAESARIPAMIVQTLVENAVKHGVGAIRTSGRIEVNATVFEERLLIEVRDNGPGFEESAMRSFHRSGSGHGLRNVRERLRGYFGEAARLSIGRDATLKMTVVNVEMPRTAQAVEVAP